MNKIIDLAAIHLSKQRSISGGNSVTKERITLNISEKFLDMLRLSFKVFSYPLNKEGKFSRKDNKIFTTLESKVCKMLTPLTNNKKDVEFDNIIAFALTVYNLGVLYIKMIRQMEEDTHSLEIKAEDTFIACLYLLKDKELDRKAILIVMRTYSILSVWTKQQRLELRSSYLLDALNTYVKYTKDEYLNPIDIAIILGFEDAKELDTKISLDNLHIENLKNLSIQYTYTIPDQMHEFVNYMHYLLNILIKEESIDKYYTDWAMTATALSRYLIRHNRFIEAKNCLAAASCMLEKLITMMTGTTTNDNQNTDSDLQVALRVEYQHECARIDKLWGQYGNQLLRVSKEKLLPNKTNQSREVDNLERECSNSTKSEEESANCLIFTNLEKEIKEKSIQIYDKDVLNLSDIKIIFEKTLARFNTAMEYFTMERDAITYGKIILYKSLAYKYFACFERHKDKRMKIYKQQIALLNNAVIKLPHKTILNNVRRLMWLELGISYTAVLDILNDGIIISDVKSYQELLLEMKNCIYNGLNCFKSYLKVP